MPSFEGQIPDQTESEKAASQLERPVLLYKKCCVTVRYDRCVGLFHLGFRVSSTHSTHVYARILHNFSWSRYMSGTFKISLSRRWIAHGWYM